MIPAHDKITATFPIPYIRSAFSNGDKFEAALRTIDEGLTAGKIYNQEFLAAKYYIAGGCEHAQHISADGAHSDAYRNLPSGDVRHDIGYAFQMNQAAKLSRNLKKLKPADLTPGIKVYIETLDQIDGLWKWLQSVKPIIVKGRKPSENPKEIDLTNTGVCAICEQRQKLNKRKMVHHGFRISDGYGHYFGHRSGQCFGTARPPYELSSLANKEYKTYLEGVRRETLVLIGDLIESKPETLIGMEYKKGIVNPVPVSYAKGTPEYEKQRQRNLREAEEQLRWLDEAIPYQQKKIDEWHAQPLKYGE